MSQYDNIKSRLINLDIKITNSKEDFNTTNIFQLECPKGHQTEQKNTSMINRLSAYSNKKCTNICGTCCNEDGILQKILPVMQAKGFELVELKDDHLNIIYKCVCGNIASSNTKNIKKSTCCAKCLNHHRNFTSLCENAKEAGFEIEMSFKEYLEDHASIKMKHLTCQQEIIKSFGINIHFVCKVCSKAKKEEQKVEIVLEQQTVKESNELKYGYKCCVENCQYYAIYLGTIKPLYCDRHYPNEGSKVMFAAYKHRMCIAEDCDRRASFNYENGMKQIFCQIHMQPKMINVASIKCIECQINTARFTYKKDYPKAKYCKVCRDKKLDKEDIVDCLEKLCNPPDCWRQAIFGYSHLNKREWKCKEHKKDDMVDVKNIHNLCKFIGCGAQANYGIDKKPTHCKEHKEIGMNDIYHKRCEFEGCTIRPSYNFIQFSKPVFCVQHKKIDMVDVVSARCREENCLVQPKYNYLNEKIPMYCYKHAKENMYDIHNKMCEIENCYSQALYGLVGKSPTFCRIHIKNGMMKYPNKMCSAKACREKASYGYIGTFPIYCELHHDKEKHYNLIEQKCSKCNLLYILDENNLCLYCSPLKKSEHLTKQRVIKDFLDLHQFKINSYDQKIKGGCGKERPDFSFECAGYFLILEVDEYQHSHYNVECENTRMINISQSLGMPVIFLRYNPDRFTINNKVIDIPKKIRLQELKKMLDQYLYLDLNLLKYFCSVVYLFYNDYDVDDRKCILPFE